MRNLPPQIIQVLRRFELLFSERVWEWVTILIVGAILAPGKRTVTACLRVMGLSHDKQFQTYHRVLNRAKWSSRKTAGVLLSLLVQAFVRTDAPIVLGSTNISNADEAKRLQLKVSIAILSAPAKPAL